MASFPLNDKVYSDNEGPIEQTEMDLNRLASATFSPNEITSVQQLIISDVCESDNTTSSTKAVAEVEAVSVVTSADVKTDQPIMRLCKESLRPLIDDHTSAVCDKRNTCSQEVNVVMTPDATDDCPFISAGHQQVSTSEDNETLINERYLNLAVTPDDEAVYFNPTSTSYSTIDEPAPDVPPRIRRQLSHRRNMSAGDARHLYVEISMARELLRQTDEIMTEFGDRVTLPVVEDVMPKVWSIHCVLSSFVELAEQSRDLLGNRLLHEFSGYMAVVEPLLLTSSVVLLVSNLQHTMSKVRRNCIQWEQPDLQVFDQRLADISKRQASLLSKVRVAGFMLMSLTNPAFLTPASSEPTSYCNDVSTSFDSVSAVISEIESELSDLNKSIVECRRVLESVHARYCQLARWNGLFNMVLSTTLMSAACLMAYQRHAATTIAFASLSILPMALNANFIPDDLALMMLSVQNRYLRLDEYQRSLSSVRNRMQQTMKHRTKTKKY